MERIVCTQTSRPGRGVLGIRKGPDQQPGLRILRACDIVPAIVFRLGVGNRVVKIADPSGRVAIPDTRLRNLWGW